MRAQSERTVSEGQKDMLTLIVALIVLPFIVMAFGAPEDAVIATAIVTWLIASALTVGLIALRREQRREGNR
jgi:hypothetical protein